MKLQDYKKYKKKKKPNSNVLKFLTGLGKQNKTKQKTKQKPNENTTENKMYV